jgi:D-alanine-D-alanine ligase-like ATP-grasp enzyme
MTKGSLLRLAVERNVARIRKIIEDKIDWSSEVYVDQRVPEYREMWQAVARELGAGFIALTDDLWELELKGQRTRVLNYKLEFDDPVTLEMAGMKPLMYRLMKENGLQVPEHLIFRLESLEAAEQFLRQHQKGCVVKPARGTSSGKGVTTHIRTVKQLRRAAILASLYCRDLIIETLVPGESYRLLVLNGEVVHAVRRGGLKLRGDGTATVMELIHQENTRRKESGDQGSLDIDDDCHFTLGYQNLSLQSVPATNEVFLVKTVNSSRKRVEVRTIYSETVTEILCPSLRRDAERAAGILRSDFLGVDVITMDPTVSLEKSGGVISEVNTTPGLHHHYQRGTERFPRAAVEAIALLLERKAAYPGWYSSVRLAEQAGKSSAT